jgi:hypothetical protein
MSNTTNNMKLTIWDSPSDTFIYTEIADNFTKIAAHDHSGSINGKGAQLDAGVSLIDTSITGAKIATDAITTAKIKNSTGTSDGVTTAKIADNAITTAKIADITTGSETTTGVTSLKIANSAITTVKLEDSTSPTYTNGVTSAKLANNSVITRTIASNAVTFDKVDSTVIPTFQSSSGATPTSPSNNAQFYTTVTSANNTTSANPATFPTFWSFRYSTYNNNLTSSPENKWLFNGGAPLTVMNFDSQTIAATNYTSISGTSLTLPYVGAYLISFSAQIDTGTTAINTIKVNLTPSSTVTTYEATLSNANTASQNRFITQSRIVNVTSSTDNAFNLYAYGNTAANIDNICITATPIYITSHV